MVDHLQHGREQLCIGGEEVRSGIGTRQPPKVAHRHSRDNAVDPGGRRFPPCSASRKRGKTRVACRRANPGYSLLAARVAGFDVVMALKAALAGNSRLSNAVICVLSRK